MSYSLSKFQIWMRALSACFLALCLPSILQAQLGRVVLSPPLQIINLDDRERVHSYEISNQGESRIQIGIEVVNWTKDDTNKFSVIPPEPNSLDQWMVVSPLELEVAPKSSRIVRFAIRPAVPLPDGEHRAALIFKQLPEEDQAEADDPDKLVIRNLFTMRSAVYASVGDVQRTGTVDEIELRSDSLRTFIISKGNAHVRPSGTFQIWETDAFPGKENALKLNHNEPTPGLTYTGELTHTSVLNGQNHWVSHRFKEKSLPAGNYTVLINGHVGNSPLQEVYTAKL